MTLKYGKIKAIWNGAHTHYLWVRTMWEAWSWRSEQGTVVSAELAMTVQYSLHCLSKSAVSWKEKKVGTARTHSSSAAAFRAPQQTYKNLRPVRTRWCGTNETLKAKSLAKYRGVIAACLSSRQRWTSLWLSYRLQVYHRQLINFLHLLWRTLKCVFTLGLLKPCLALRRKTDP